ncbi:MAG: hypothetical protein U0353_18205 [Sandaracinus sp.]
MLGRRGAFWMERYDDDAVLDDAAAEAAIHYFHANPVRAHVVERADDYVGVSSWKAYAEDLDTLTRSSTSRAGGARARRSRWALHEDGDGADHASAELGGSLGASVARRCGR